MRLLVGYLATTGGADAIAVANMIAGTVEVTIDLVVVVPQRDITDALTPSGGYHEHVAANARQWLDEGAALVAAGVAVKTHVYEHESFAEGIIEAAQRLESDAIVVGGSGGIVASLSLGSVVNQLLHASPVPVVLSPNGFRDVRAERVGEVTCALGQRAGAEVLFDTAVQVTETAGIPLRLVSLVALDETRWATPADRRKPALEHAENVVAEARALLPATADVTSIVTDGATVEAAIEKLEWRDGDVLFVGSSRLAQPRRLFLGSTAARMLRVLKVPVVVVPRSVETE